MSILVHIPVVTIVKQGAKIVNHLSGGQLDYVVKGIEDFTNSAGYNHMRLENLRDNLYSTWDDHKDEVFDLLHSAGETISNCLEHVGDALVTVAGTLVDSISES